MAGGVGVWLWGAIFPCVALMGWVCFGWIQCSRDLGIGILVERGGAVVWRATAARTRGGIHNAICAGVVSRRGGQRWNQLERTQAVQKQDARAFSGPKLFITHVSSKSTQTGEAGVRLPLACGRLGGTLKRLRYAKQDQAWPNRGSSRQLPATAPVSAALFPISRMVTSTPAGTASKHVEGEELIGWRHQLPLQREGNLCKKHSPEKIRWKDTKRRSPGHFSRKRTLTRAVTAIFRASSRAQGRQPG